MCLPEARLKDDPSREEAILRQLCEHVVKLDPRDTGAMKDGKGRGWRRILSRVARLNALLVIGAVLLVLFANVRILREPLARDRRPTSARDFIPNAEEMNGPPWADCILILGAGLWGSRPSFILEDRLKVGLGLYRAKRSRKILLSGDHVHPSYDETNTMRRWLERHGVPPEDIFMDHAGIDTFSSMQRAKTIFGASKVIVVTQAFHLQRALYIGRHMGLEAEGVPADLQAYRRIRQHRFREVFSRVKAILDVARGRAAKGGPPIDLAKSGMVTRDDRPVGMPEFTDEE